MYSTVSCFAILCYSRWPKVSLGLGGGGTRVVTSPAVTAWQSLKLVYDLCPP